MQPRVLSILAHALGTLHFFQPKHTHRIAHRPPLSINWQPRALFSHWVFSLRFVITGKLHILMTAQHNRYSQQAVMQWRDPFSSNASLAIQLARLQDLQRIAAYMLSSASSLSATRPYRGSQRETSTSTNTPTCLPSHTQSLVPGHDARDGITIRKGQC